MSRIGPFVSNLTIVRGSTYEDVLTLTNDDGTPFPLGGVTARMQVRDSTCPANQTPAVPPFFTLTSAASDGLAIDVLSGTITRAISAARALLVPAGSRDAVFDLFLYYPDGTDDCLLRGNVAIVDRRTEP